MRSIYLDTSVISAYHDLRVPEFSELTREMFTKLGSRFVFYISPTVLSEIANANALRRKQMLGLVRSLGLRSLLNDPAILMLASSYVSRAILPKDSLADATHLAHATVHKMDYLLSWNFRHLVNEHRKEAFMHHNLSRGLHLPMILSPGNLLEGVK